jgi:hypothetical protein
MNTIVVGYDETDGSDRAWIAPPIWRRHSVRA